MFLDLLLEDGSLDSEVVDYVHTVISAAQEEENLRHSKEDALQQLSAAVVATNKSNYPQGIEPGKYYTAFTTIATEEDENLFASYWGDTWDSGIYFRDGVDRDARFLHPATVYVLDQPQDGQKMIQVSLQDNTLAQENESYSDLPQVAMPEEVLMRCFAIVPGEKAHTPLVQPAEVFLTQLLDVFSQVPEAISAYRKSRHPISWYDLEDIMDRHSLYRVQVKRFSDRLIGKKLFFAIRQHNNGVQDVMFLYGSLKSVNGDTITVDYGYGVQSISLDAFSYDNHRPWLIAD